MKFYMVQRTKPILREQNILFAIGQVAQIWTKIEKKSYAVGLEMNPICASLPCNTENFDYEI